MIVALPNSTAHASPGGLPIGYPSAVISVPNPERGNWRSIRRSWLDYHAKHRVSLKAYTTHRQHQRHQAMLLHLSSAATCADFGGQHLAVYPVISVELSVKISAHSSLRLHPICFSFFPGRPRLGPTMFLLED